MQKIYVQLEKDKVTDVSLNSEENDFHPLPIELPDGVMIEILRGYSLEQAQKKAQQIRVLHDEMGTETISDAEIEELYDEACREATTPGFPAKKFGRKVIQRYNQNILAERKTCGSSP